MEIIYQQENELVVKVLCDNFEEKEELINFVNNKKKNIVVNKKGREFVIDINDIFYIESIEKSTIVYTSNEYFHSVLWLYQIETMLSDDFIRINKSTIININYLDSMKSDIGSRILLEFVNGDKFIVTRSYSKNFKRKIGGK